MDPLSLVDKIASLTKALWRRYRFRGRAELSLSWQHAALWVVPGPNPKWRAVAFAVIASKSEEFVVAHGVVEYRSHKQRRWQHLGALDQITTLPIIVQANRRFDGLLSGPSLAKLFPQSIGSAETVQLRLTLFDHHNSEITSDSLATSVSELQIERSI